MARRSTVCSRDLGAANSCVIGWLLAKGSGKTGVGLLTAASRNSDWSLAPSMINPSTALKGPLLEEVVDGRSHDNVSISFEG